MYYTFKEVYKSIEQSYMKNKALKIISNGWPSYQVNIENELKLDMNIHACCVFKLHICLIKLDFISYRTALIIIS